jgi:hypothetical protein
MEAWSAWPRRSRSGTGNGVAAAGAALIGMAIASPEIALNITVGFTPYRKAILCAGMGYASRFQRWDLWPHDGDMERIGGITMMALTRS